jgi:RNA polymerase sigma factor FliA
LAPTVDRAQLIEKYGQYVRSLANTVRKQFNIRLDVEDLISYGNVGLFEAAERFDPKLGANFLTFAHYRIKGAIFDGLRKMGTLKGGDQRAVYLSDRLSAYLASAAARDMGGPRAFVDDVREVESVVTSLAAIFATSLDGMDHLQIRDEATNPEDRLEVKELKERVKEAIKKLPDNERQLLIGYYYEGKTLEDAGAAIGQSKSWASRLHARAVERLKEYMAEDMEIKDAGKAGGEKEAGSPSGGRRPGSGLPSRPTGTR